MGRLGRLARAGVVAGSVFAVALGVTGTARAATPSVPRTAAPANPVAVSVRNETAVSTFSVAIDGVVRVGRLRPGGSSSIVVDPGGHELAATIIDASGTPTDQVRATRLSVEGRALTATIGWNGITIDVGGGSKPTARDVAPILPIPKPKVVKEGFRSPVGLGEAVLWATLLSALTGSVVALLVYGRNCVKDERTMLRMQQAAQRSLDNLPPLTIGRAARRGTAGRPSAQPAAPRSVAPPQLRPSGEAASANSVIVRGGRLTANPGRRKSDRPTSTGESGDASTTTDRPEGLLTPEPAPASKTAESATNPASSGADSQPDQVPAEPIPLARLLAAQAPNPA